MTNEVYEPKEDPNSYGILDGETCPCCGDGFCRGDVVVYAELIRDVSYYFHRRCLTRGKEIMLEGMGFDLEEREGRLIG